MSRHRVPTIVALVAVLSFVGSLKAEDMKESAATQPAGATGTWKWTQQGRNGEVEIVLTLKQDGEKLTGTITGRGGETEIKDGTVKDGNITFKTTQSFGGNDSVTTYNAKIENGAIKGKSETVMSRTFEGKRSS